MSRARAYDARGAITQAKTAVAWAKRAARAYARAARAQGAAREEALLDGECARGEALEHAGLVADYGRTVARVQRMLDAARERAWRR